MTWFDLFRVLCMVILIALNQVLEWPSQMNFYGAISSLRGYTILGSLPNAPDALPLGGRI